MRQLVHAFVRRHWNSIRRLPGFRAAYISAIGQDAAVRRITGEQYLGVEWTAEHGGPGSHVARPRSTSSVENETAG